MCDMNHPTCKCGHDCDDHVDGYGCQIEGCGCREYDGRDLDRCPGCGKERPTDRPPGPPPIPGQWYCVNHRHLQRRRDYA